MPLDVASQAAGIVLAAGLLLVLARLARDAVTTSRIIADAQTIRRHRSVRILASERICVPFSFWLPARYFIIVPSELVLRSEDLRLAICHELQHHRQQCKRRCREHDVRNRSRRAHYPRSADRTVLSSPAARRCSRFCHGSRARRRATPLDPRMPPIAGGERETGAGSVR